MIDICPNCQGNSISKGVRITSEELKEISRKFQERIKDLPEDEDDYCEPIICNGIASVIRENTIQETEIPIFNGEWG